jgi:hypothetical protein
MTKPTGVFLADGDSRSRQRICPPLTIVLWQADEGNRLEYPCTSICCDEPLHMKYSVFCLRSSFAERISTGFRDRHALHADPERY